jgi:hypothetical protein
MRFSSNRSKILSFALFVRLKRLVNISLFKKFSVLNFLKNLKLNFKFFNLFSNVNYFFNLSSPLLKQSAISVFKRKLFLKIKKENFYKNKKKFFSKKKTSLSAPRK